MGEEATTGALGIVRRGVVLVVAVLTAAGCGGGNHKIVFSKPVNEQIASYEYARSVNLRAEDLPRMESVGEEEEDTATHTTLRLGGCRVRHVAGGRSFVSPTFLTHESSSLSSLLTTGRMVGSSVLVFPHVARPTADPFASSPAVRECLRRADDKRERFSDEHLVSLKPIPIHLSHVKSFGSRATTVHVLVLRGGRFLSGRHFTEYEDVLGFLLGRAEIIEVADSRGTPFPAKQEHELLALLYLRAKKAKAP
jgi:hypothetical protein